MWRPKQKEQEGTATQVETQGQTEPSEKDNDRDKGDSSDAMLVSDEEENLLQMVVCDSLKECTNAVHEGEFEGIEDLNSFEVLQCLMHENEDLNQ